GVCLAGAVQDFLVLSASIRRNGKSLAQIAFHDIGPIAGVSAMIAILFILVIALAGLGKVVVKALGGEPAYHVPGSSWGTFTIAATIPIALFIGLYMNRLRRGRVLEASIVGGLLTIGATVLGGWVAQRPIGHYFNLTAGQVVWAMAVYGFIAAVLPVWVLLVPRDYLSSFLKIGTIVLLVGGVIVANPTLRAPAINSVFTSGGPVVKGKIFPFLFITIMCGAISGFHALVSSGTTPKMVKRESDARMIGYGAMLMEGLVGVVAMIAAATLPVGDYYAMNTEIAAMPAFHDQIIKIPGGGIEHVADYEVLTQESLRGRTGGAVTLAVGMAEVFDHSLGTLAGGARWLWKYWYHFAIMFEALFILTTIDAGTRIGRFLLQEMLGKIHPKLGQTNWWPSAYLSTAIIVGGWAYFINADSFAAIWAMFGVANQMLAVIALAVVSVYLVNEGRAKYLWVTVVPLAVVMTTTSTAAVQILIGKVDGIRTQIAKDVLTAAERALLMNSAITAALLVAMMACTVLIIASAGVRIAGVRRP
ncbi:MAG TPA: carbon starvation CstA family protein, partial [Tepidisphaeraceae bacterium]|nr:carbon starvation CstA family protein [Tepidisphaeraceae bacterium]